MRFNKKVHRVSQSVKVMSKGKGPKDIMGTVLELGACSGWEDRHAWLRERLGQRGQVQAGTEDGPQNIVVPARQTANGIVVLTAHYDCVLGSRGYYDNNSGVAGLLALSESGGLPDYCEYVFTDQEEWGYCGASHYVENCPHAIRFNVNLDIIGIPPTIYIREYGRAFSVPPGYSYCSLPRLVWNDSTAFEAHGIASVIVMSAPEVQAPADNFLGMVGQYMHCNERDNDPSVICAEQIVTVCHFVEEIITLNIAKDEAREIDKCQRGSTRRMRHEK